AVVSRGKRTGVGWLRQPIHRELRTGVAVSIPFGFENLSFLALDVAQKCAGCKETRGQQRPARVDRHLSMLYRGAERRCPRLMTRHARTFRSHDVLYCQ